MKKLLLLFAASAMLFSCDQNDDSPSSPGQSDSNFVQNFGTSVSRDFIGQIVDASNNPIISATVKIGSTSVQTDVNGVFIINGASVHEKFAYIIATKPGFFDGSRSIVPTSGKNNVKIMLVESTALETVASGAASEVSIYSGTKINFDGAFEDENGNAYSGDVNVSVFHLTPSNPDISSLMPGMLYAETATGTEAVLQTFGMINVELRGSAGQKLQIAEGHSAQITLRIDDDQLATAPSTIPLWHFDEAGGWWKEDGSATKQGNYYVGNVGHFSWWNCDFPYPVVQLSLSIQNPTGVPISSCFVLFSANPGESYGVRSDNLGQVSLTVPANQTLTMEINNSCMEVVYSDVLGPFSSDTVLPITVCNAFSIFPVTLHGNLLNCNGQLVTNGYVKISMEGSGQIFVPMTDGNFSYTTLTCSEIQPATIRGADYDTAQTSPNVQFTLQAPQTDLGAITACGTLDEFVSYQIDDQPIVMITSSLLAATDQFFYFGFYTTIYPGIQIIFNNSLPIIGSYTTTDGLYQIFIENIIINSSSPNTLVATISLIDGIGDFVDITLNGTYSDAQGVTHTVNLSGHIMRQF